MEPQLDAYERLKQCTVKILLPGKAGTGFFVGPGLILTCAHVVEDASNSSVEVYWDDPSHSDKSHPAQIISCDHLADLALLRVDLPYNPCVLLDEEAEPFDHLYSYGYPNDRPQGDSATFILEGKAGELGEELKLKEGQVRPGLSGAPLLNLETGYVCGVMRLTRNRETDLGGRGISTTRVFETFPNLKTRQRELHPRVRRWTSLFKQGSASTLEESNRQQMLRRVYDKWIVDYLEKSLHPATIPIKLRLSKEPNALSRHPQLPQERNRSVDFFPTETTIREVYEKADGQLLILGEPGSGKTILLLALARTLLEDAALDDTYLMPVVFKLSSWAAWVVKRQKHQPILDDWLIEELKIKYQIPEEIGRPWIIQDKRVLPLLDGLDEMDFDQQLACIQSINHYLQEHGKGTRIVVSCRKEDYFRHEEHILLQKAVTVQPLEEEQINAYLSSTGEHLENLETVRQALRDYPTVRKLAEIPLMLSVITQTYNEVPVEDLAAMSSPDAQRQQIFETYVENMHVPPGGIAPLYSLMQTKQWLTWLANQLAQHSQTEFYIERLQLDWLPNKQSRLLYRLIVSGLVGGLVGGLLFGLIIGLFSHLLSVSVNVPLLAMPVGVIGWLITFLGGVEIKPLVTELGWSLANVGRDLLISLLIGLVSTFFLGLINYLLFDRSPVEAEHLSSFFKLGFYGLFVLLSIADYALFGTLAGLTYGFLSRKLKKPNLIVAFQDKRYFAQIGVLIGLVVGVSELLVFALYTNAINCLLGVCESIPSNYLAYDLSFGIISGLLSGLIGGLLFGLIHGLSAKKLEVRDLSAPNQGIWHAARNSIRVGLLVGLSVWLIVGLLIGLTIRSTTGLVDGLLFGLSNGLLFGLAGGLISGLSNGGYACIQHIILRLFLCRAGAMPWHYPRFLDYADDLKLLRKVGGGYVFLHRLLQEYFASLQSTSVNDAVAQQEL